MAGGYSDSSFRQQGSGTPLIGTIPLRIASAAVLLYLHAWHHTQSGWQFLWHQQPWELPLLLAKAKFPYVNPLAIATVAISFAVTVSWLIGFLTRLFSLLFIPVLLGAILAANRLEEYAAAETAMLYVLIAITLVVTGSGWFSVDTVFEMNRNPKRKR